MGKFREWVNNNSAIMTVVAVVVLLASLGLLVWLGQRPEHPPPAITEVYFYDLGTKSLITKSNADPSPTDGSGPGMAVRAFVFGCGDCSTPFVGYLQKLTDEAIKADAQIAEIRKSKTTDQEQLKLVPGLQLQVENGTLISTPESGAWTQPTSPLGRAMMAQMHTKCGEGAEVKPCEPPKKGP